MDLPFEPTPMDRALWCIYSTTAREAAKHGAELIMLGQLADELFGGYMKYARAAEESEEAAAAMMLADVVASGREGVHTGRGGRRALHRGEVPVRRREAGGVRPRGSGQLQDPRGREEGCPEEGGPAARDCRRRWPRRAEEGRAVQLRRRQACVLRRSDFWHTEDGWTRLRSRSTLRLRLS